MHAQRTIFASIICALTIGAAVIATTAPAPAIAPKHPNDNLFVYLVRDYVGRPPEGDERLQWDCWDDTVKGSMNCSLFKGPLTKYRYIYRQKNASRMDLNRLCDVIMLDLDKATYEFIVALDNMKGRHGACERVTYERLALLKDIRLMNVTVRMAAAKCWDAAYAEETVKDAKSNVNDDEEELAKDKQRCARDREAEERQRDFEQREARKEEQNYLNATALFDFGTNLSDGKIDCFGGCRSIPVSPRGPYSTITSRSWGDKAPPDTNSPVRSAR